MMTGCEASPQDVHRMKVAVAQAVAVRHMSNSVEQVALSPVIETRGHSDVICKPDLEVGELDPRMGVNAHVQSHHALEISRNLT